ncbi:biopolymer transporter ExbD [uncultured Pseudosulfitobacter sp.]|uniref:biopolymer transporter ExbD n=1 Tax=uncultured Pseudosulfitobacter sp. TaxID=2854214 RepID=UPI0030D91370|tara:strand:- start:4666 stop:5052 length:387 start_codon:yes stop_codon:yes gene_type:complete
MPLRAVRQRRKLSMTSLIDVIFLLLLFFMLSSTFSKFAEVEVQAASGGRAASGDQALAFLRATPQGLTLNGTALGVDDLPQRLRDLQAGKPLVLLVNLNAQVDAQAMTDILVAVRGIPDLAVSVMGAS